MKKNTVLKHFLVILILLTGDCFAQSPCNFHTSTAHDAAGIYVGNSQEGRFILIGTINVPKPCITKGVTFYGSHIDSVSLNDQYEMSIYCINGDCVPLSRVLDTGLLTTDQFFPNCPSSDYFGGCFVDRHGMYPHYAPYGKEPESLYWINGPTVLPAGNYALAMGTDCQAGNLNCGQAYGEASISAEPFNFKVFTSLWPKWKQCLVWSNGLPDALCVTPVNNPTTGAPHMIDFEVW